MLPIVSGGVIRLAAIAGRSVPGDPPPALLPCRAELVARTGGARPNERAELSLGIDLGQLGHNSPTHQLTNYYLQISPACSLSFASSASIHFFNSPAPTT